MSASASCTPSFLANGYFSGVYLPCQSATKVSRQVTNALGSRAGSLCLLRFSEGSEVRMEEGAERPWADTPPPPPSATGSVDLLPVASDNSLRVVICSTLPVVLRVVSNEPPTTRSNVENLALQVAHERRRLRIIFDGARVSRTSNVPAPHAGHSTCLRSLRNRDPLPVAGRVALDVAQPQLHEVAGLVHRFGRGPNLHRLNPLHG